MNIEVRPFQLHDLSQVELTEEAECLKCIIMHRDANFEGGPAFTFWNGDQVLFCAGVMLIWEGVGEAWTNIDVEAIRYPRLLLHYHRWYLQRVITECRLHRVQALTLTSWHQAWRFLEKLRFHREGILSKLGPHGEDFYLYARITS